MYSSKTKVVLRIKVEYFHYSLWLVETKTLNMPIQLHCFIVMTVILKIYII